MSTSAIGVLTPDSLRDFATAVLVEKGVPRHDARVVADSLVHAELWGHSSHGMLRLPWYVARLSTTAMSAVTAPTTVNDTGSLVILDGHDGIGQVLTQHAVELGVERARAHGISGVAVRNSNHFGTAAYFTRQAARAGCVALLFTNASPAMAPWGGRRKTIGTNPWSIAAPAGRYGVAVMDLANTAVARGKLYLAAELGRPIPQGWAADAEGRPTTDPRQGIDGLILPMAGAKGYVISFMVDILAGVLTGSGFGDSITGPYQPTERSGCGHLLLTIDVAALGDFAEFEHRVEALIDDTKATDRAAGVEEIFFPGELEDRAALANERGGIALADATWDTLVDLAADTQVAMPLPVPTKEIPQ